MKHTTIETLTAEQLTALRDEAARAGDDALVLDCRVALYALGCYHESAAVRRCVAAIREREAQQ
jgi:hypothetical protein